jgi:hypothetical protein
MRVTSENRLAPLLQVVEEEKMKACFLEVVVPRISISKTLIIVILQLIQETDIE